MRLNFKNIFFNPSVTDRNKGIDINCDMGEGIGNDVAIMPYINSANIACGFHAGSEKIMRETIALAKKYNVLVGAHPSFKDKENFGRKEKNLSQDEIYALVIQQLVKINLLCKEMQVFLHHVKPHGALYNMSARDEKIAATIAHAIKDFNEELILYGLSGSLSISEAKKIGLKTASEVFADRSYQADGSLTPRSHPSALIEDENIAIQQVMNIVNEGQVVTVTGKLISINAETVCIHSDGKNAAEFAKCLYENLNNISKRKK